MSLKRIVLTMLGVFGILYFANAQSNILNAKTPDQIHTNIYAVEEEEDKPLAYGYVDQRDILWSTTIWETIDLNQRMNFALYYPIDTIGTDRQSLYHALMKEIKSGDLTEIYTDSYFTEKRNFQDLEATLSKVDTTDLGYEQLNAGESLSAEFVNRRDISGADIIEYRIKGMWYFDKRLGELRYRLLGIAPVAPDVNFIDDESIDPMENKVELFWVWYPAAREILHKVKVFNGNNSSQRISFDMLLNSRRFAGMIYREENVQGDRNVNEYITDNAMLQLLEARRIKEKIRDKEQDMWAY